MADPAMPLHRLWTLPDAERDSILDDWNDTVAAAPDRLLHEAFEDRAREQPAAVAITFDGADMTYGELESRSAELARHLRRLGVGPESIVALCLERGFDLVVALLGVMRAGGAYLPLDPEASQERIGFMLEDARPAAVLTSEKLLARVPQYVAPALVLDRDRPRVDEDPAGPVTAGVDGSNLAYVLYTSGSTGRPKGVMVGHEAIANRIAWMQRTYGLRGDDRVLQKTPYGFDVSVWEIFWPLVTGSRLVMAAPGGHRDADYLSRLIQDRGVTVCHFVPSLLNAFLDQFALEDRCASLRLVVTSGEELHVADQRRFFEGIDAELHNLYGPTEAAVDVSSWACRPDATDRTVPIGRPIDNVTLYVLDDRLEPVPVGVRGDLYIGGIALARGYLGRPDLTAERFVPDPFAKPRGQRLYYTGDLARYLPDGAIEFAGRSDFQVKIRGFRIELGEVEAVLGEHPGVAATVVDARSDGAGAKRLVAYVVPDGAPLAANEMKAFLAARLPEYMVPAAYVTLPALPLTATGKTDRKGLPEPDADESLARDYYVAPRTPEEELVAGVWSGALGVDRVGAADRFFDLGGDSIRAIAVVGALRDRGADVSVQDLFVHGSVAELAELLGGRPAATEREPVTPFELLAPPDVANVPEGIDDAYPLSLTQVGMVYEMLSDSRQANYHNVTSYWVRGVGFSLTHLQEAARIAAGRHEIFRTAFDLTSFSEPVQLVHRAAEVEIGFEDLRGLDAAAQDRRVGDFIAAERASSFDLSRPPLYRLYVHVTQDDAWRMSLCECHAILDGWSHNSFVTELLHLYRSLRAGESPEAYEGPPVRFADFVALEREAVGSDDDALFWQDRLERFPALHLPNEVGGEGRGDSVLERLVPFGDLDSALRRAARTCQVPLKSVLHAVHLTVLGELTGQRRFFSGLVSNGRPEVRGGDRVRGLFLNSLPFGIDLDGAETWRALAQAAFAEEIEAWPYRRFPLPEMQRRWGKGAPLLETLFTFVDFHVLDRDLVDLDRTMDASPNEFPLQVILDGQAFLVTADGARLDPAVFEWLCDAYRSALERFAGDPDSAARPEQRRPPANAAPAGGPSPVVESPGVEAHFEPPRTPLETTIAEVWCDLLAIERIGVNDDFRDLGGDSLLLLRTASRLQERGVDVAARHVLERRTIAGLAGLIEETHVTSSGVVRDESFRSLVWLKEDGTLPALFCVHPGGGSTHWYVQLAEQLDCAVAAFEAPGLAGETEPLLVVEDAALLYLDELRRAQPEGPYHLFSWCGGSGVAIEMAARMRAAGEEVAFVLLDPAVDGVDQGALAEQEELFGRCEKLYARLRVGLPEDEAETARGEVFDLLVEAGV
ncbi:MAG: amino acid adenylation domain-containing protein, partial [Actinomycetota bacterium]|nr:amino acid adenylation domain-containing protein [Actinomycetota bacterium]